MDLRLRRFCLGDHLLELAVLDHLGDNVQSTQELALEEDHGEGGPVDMCLESLTDVVVLQNIERVVCHLLICQKCHQFPMRKKKKKSQYYSSRSFTQQ